MIPKSNNKDRLAQNLDVLDFDLTEDDMKEIKSIDRGLRFNDPLNVSRALNPHLIVVVADMCTVWGLSANLCLSYGVTLLNRAWMRFYIEREYVKRIGAHPSGYLPSSQHLTARCTNLAFRYCRTDLACS